MPALVKRFNAVETDGGQLFIGQLPLAHCLLKLINVFFKNQAFLFGYQGINIQILQLAVDVRGDFTAVVCEPFFARRNDCFQVNENACYTEKQQQKDAADYFSFSAHV